MGDRTNNPLTAGLSPSLPSRSRILSVKVCMCVCSCQDQRTTASLRSGPVQIHSDPLELLLLYQNSEEVRE